MSDWVDFNYTDEVLDRCLAKAEADFPATTKGGTICHGQRVTGTAEGGTLPFCTNPELGVTNAGHA